MAIINRQGDKVKIEGAYQHNALHKGNIFQRNWHRLKLQAAAEAAGTTTGDDVLDVGCGSGVLLPFLPHRLHSYVGLDANEAAVRFARQTYTHSDTHFQLHQIDSLDQLRASSFSNIFFLETIEHITEEQGAQALQQFHRLLKPGGICVISTPNRKSLWPAIEWSLDLFRLTPRMKDDQHEKLYSIRELKKIAANAGFLLQRVQTINGIAPWTSFLGTTATEAIHRWEMRNNWFPGSLILMTLQKQKASS